MINTQVFYHPTGWHRRRYLRRFAKMKSCARNVCAKMLPWDSKQLTCDIKWNRTQSRIWTYPKTYFQDTFNTTKNETLAKSNRKSPDSAHC